MDQEYFYFNGVLMTLLFLMELFLKEAFVFIGQT